MAVFGYARVSTIGQSLDVQLDKLNEYGCDKIFQEKRSGTTEDQHVTSHKLRMSLNKVMLSLSLLIRILIPVHQQVS